MSQFAYFTGGKPQYKNLVFVPLNKHHPKNYVGSALTEPEIDETWVIDSPDSEPIDEMSGEAMTPAQLEGTIKNTELNELISGYIKKCHLITFIYGVYEGEIPVYTDPNEFIKVITQSLSEPPFKIYAKYYAS